MSYLFAQEFSFLSEMVRKYCFILVLLEILLKQNVTGFSCLREDCDVRFGTGYWALLMINFFWVIWRKAFEFSILFADLFTSGDAQQKTTIATVEKCSTVVIVAKSAAKQKVKAAEECTDSLVSALPIRDCTAWSRATWATMGTLSEPVNRSCLGSKLCQKEQFSLDVISDILRVVKTLRKHPSWSESRLKMTAVKCLCTKVAK